MIYILLPAYNEANNIGPLLRTIEEETQRAGSPIVHAVVVNDGSTDSTGDEVRAFEDAIKVSLLEHDTNWGLGAALFTGIQYILNRCEDTDEIITLDADGTHHPRYIFQLVKQIEAGYDIAVASRYAQGGKEIGVNWYRKLLSHGARRLYGFCFAGWPLRDFSCGFRAIRAETLRRTVDQWNEKLFETPGFACTGELMLKLLAHTSPERVTEIPFELHYECKEGVSKMPALKTILGTLKLLLKAREVLK